MREAITDLESDRYEHGLLRGEGGAERYAAVMTKLEAHLEELRALPQLPVRQEVSAGQRAESEPAGR